MNGGRARALTLTLALALDLALGEPPARLHPVVGIGALTRRLERTASGGGPVRQVLVGVCIALAVPALAGGAALLGGRALARRGVPGLLLESVLLKPTFAVRALLAAGAEVERALAAADADGARYALRALVSRETGDLPPALLAAAAIESLAENATDSFIAPWLAYAIGGLPGAYAYRALNTLDSMIGYRGRYEYLGKAAARLDDLANLLPARLGTLLLVAAAQLREGSGRAALHAAWRYRRRTASPNAGWTMAAMAGALGVRLEKRGHYLLGNGREPEARDLARARRITGTTAWLALLTAGGVAILLERGAAWRRRTAD